MKAALRFVGKALLGGALVLIPIYIAVLLLLKAAGSLLAVVKPIASALPESWPAEQLLALLLVLAACFLVGVVVRSRIGDAAREWIEKNVLQRIPGYTMVRSLAHRVAGKSEEDAWKPALVEIEDALVPAFIIEEVGDGRVTVFVPSVPTPFAGAVYVLASERVHPVDVPFTQAVTTISKWGSGSKDLVAAMKTEPVSDRGQVR
jgi:uncharacterized membrane protein